MKKYYPLWGLGALLIIVVAIIFLQPPEKMANGGTTAYHFGGSKNSSCNVASVAISGFLDTETSSDNEYDSWQISQAIDNMDLDGKVGVVVLMDSNGGSPAAAEEISRSLQKIKLPVVTFVRGAALSGGYWIAASTNHIVALDSSLIGNIGVNSSYLDQSKSNEDQGLIYEHITSGEYKDAGSIDKPTNPTDKAYLQSLTDDLFQLFSSVVINGRGLSKEQFAAVDDGKYYIGDKAIGMGLIDEIGDLDQVKAYLTSKTGTPTDNLVLCDPVSYDDY